VDCSAGHARPARFPDPRGPIDAVTAHIVLSSSKLTDASRAAVFTLIKELLAIGRSEEIGSRLSMSEATVSPRRDGVTRFVYAAYVC
jgi:hypothetical protein